jgi:hypothetical protein
VAAVRPAPHEACLDVNLISAGRNPKVATLDRALVGDQIRRDFLKRFAGLVLMSERRGFRRAIELNLLVGYLHYRNGSS